MLLIAQGAKEAPVMQPMMEAHPSLDESSWYAVSTRSRQEKVAAAMLDGLGIRYFLPLIEEARRWSDRQKVVSVPPVSYTHLDVYKRQQTILARLLDPPNMS